MDSASARLVVILGPTASGKSELAIRLARELNGEVLACDSTQVYRHFDIGTGKVPPSERCGVPHHLIDLVEPHEVFTAGDYAARATTALADVTARRKLPIMTAGTGLYLRALLEGLSDAPARSEELRERLRRRARAKGPLYLHALLARIDPESARRIAPRDTQKIIRAIEMRVLAGKAVGEIHRAGRRPLEGYAIAKIGLNPPRAALYQRIHARVERMIASGWLDEVRRLIAQGVPPDSKPFQFIGYPELKQTAEGRMPLEAAAESIRQATRNYAKRQLTWFRKESGVQWLAGFGDEPAAAAEAVRLVRAAP
ncbi:MAG: tRNA (adenosine(37)-N6)-dimethylallyltransferase MiaA [Acidobacteriota bacterium]|nr:tRNA (adenosine(37)-N6)-dimethylallyltransferase MiaA [Acidobacteriota bacterium]